MNSDDLLNLLDQEVNADLYKRLKDQQDRTASWLERGGLNEYSLDTPPTVKYGNMVISVTPDVEMYMHVLKVTVGLKTASYRFAENPENHEKERESIRYAMYMALKKIKEQEVTYRQECDNERRKYD